MSHGTMKRVNNFLSNRGELREFKCTGAAWPRVQSVDSVDWKRKTMFTFYVFVLVQPRPDYKELLDLFSLKRIPCLVCVRMVLSYTQTTMTIYEQGIQCLHHHWSIFEVWRPQLVLEHALKKQPTMMHVKDDINGVIKFIIGSSNGEQQGRKRWITDSPSCTPTNIMYGTPGVANNEY